MRERNRQDDVNVSYKSTSKSTIENKYSGRYKNIYRFYMINS